MELDLKRWGIDDAEWTRFLQTVSDNARKGKLSCEKKLERVLKDKKCFGEDFRGYIMRKVTEAASELKAEEKEHFRFSVVEILEENVSNTVKDSRVHGETAESNEIFDNAMTKPDPTGERNKSGSGEGHLKRYAQAQRGGQFETKELWSYDQLHLRPDTASALKVNEDVVRAVGNISNAPIREVINAVYEYTAQQPGRHVDESHAEEIERLRKNIEEEALAKTKRIRKDNAVSPHLKCVKMFCATCGTNRVFSYGGTYARSRDEEQHWTDRCTVCLRECRV